METEFQPQWPQGFDFYEYGSIVPTSIQLQAHPIQLMEDRIGIGVRLFDFDESKNRLLILLIKPGTDLAMYLEIANILAARMAEADDLLIAAPNVISPDPLRLTLRFAKKFSVYEYTHQHQGQTNSIISVVIDGPAVEPAHA